MADTAAASGSETIHILITQCLQNGFFLAEGGSLCLPKDVVRRMLVGDQAGFSNEEIVIQNNRRVFPPERLKAGPLHQFFEAVTGSSQRTHPLHIIHVRDWHAPSEHYDDERRRYGAHCEANTWAAEYLDGYDAFLQPWKSAPDSQQAEALARSRFGYHSAARNLWYYDVRSDSVFDFSPPASQALRSELAQQGEPQGRASQLQLILDRLIGSGPAKPRAYVVVIGVYTDIKIRTLAIELRSRYTIENLIISDVLTDAPTLERHLEGLDFVDKVVGAEIIHNLNDLVNVLNPGAAHIIPNALIATTANFHDYRRHFLDRQKLLAFQDQRLLQYVELTGRRSLEVYNQIDQANRFLMRMGRIFLALTAALIVLRAAGWNVPADALLISGGLSVAQIITSFFLLPAAQARTNLMELVRLRNYLEAYSNVSGLLRHHLTRAERLQPDLENDPTGERARTELSLLREQLALIQDATAGMSQAFSVGKPPVPAVPDGGEDDSKKPPDSAGPGGMALPSG